MTTTRTHDEVRDQVARHYAAALEKGCCGAEAQAGSLGYAPGDLAAIPAGVEATSFGCGNPVAFTGIGEGQVVLDLGSGAGLDLILAARRVGPAGRVIGVDMTPEMIARARKNVAAAGLGNVEIREGVIEKLPVEDASVDWVISNCVINLSPDKPAVFREIARVLRPGGRMLVSDIVADDLPAWVLESAALYASCVSGAVPESDYVRMLGEAGLAEVRVIERVPYGAEAIAPIAEDVLATACCGGAAKGLASQAAKALAGRVASLRVSARKPA
jgi:SAM-dependent methyltransferase